MPKSLAQTDEGLVERNAARANALLRALRSAMEHLMAAPGSVLGTEHALTNWGEASGVDRLYYFELMDGTAGCGSVAHLRHEWTRSPHVAPATAFHLRWVPSTIAWQSSLMRNERGVLSLPALPVDAHIFWMDSPALSALLVPVSVRGVFRGFMGCDDFRSGSYWTEAEEAALYTLGAAIAASRIQAAATKLTAAWAAEVDRMTEGLMRVVAPMYERCDPYIVGHQQRVSELATVVGREMGLSGRRLQGLRVGSLVHDIGRSLVPSEIFHKTTPLSPSDISAIQKHTNAGHEILKSLDCPWPVAVMALQHHERMDGSGYPAGLRGEQISVDARILAVADAVEAMCAPRPHRPAVRITDAVRTVCQGANTLYDGAAVLACVKVVAEDGFHFDGGETVQNRVAV